MNLYCTIDTRLLFKEAPLMSQQRVYDILCGGCRGSSVSSGWEKERCSRYYPGAL